MKLINRQTYLKILQDTVDTPDIKVLTGVRRSGKSKLLEAFAEHLRKSDNKANIIHINFNLSKYESIHEYHALESYVEKQYKPHQNNYCFIDEVQMCDGFEKAINSLHAKEKYHLYVTGSNAFLQSSDLATLFVGRTFEIQVFPFSFPEYLNYFPSKNANSSLTDYISEGGMAGSYLYKESGQRTTYINNDVLNALIVRDIIQKQKIRNEQLLHSLIDFMMDNIGNLISIRFIANVLKGSKTGIDHKTVGRYLKYLSESFLFYRIRRYDIKGKRYLNSDDKYYLVDQSFRYARLGTKNMDYGRILENIVAVELLRRGYEVYVGILNKKEIDFVTIRHGEKMYIQVSYDISDKITFDREVIPLLSIRDGFQKLLVARTFQPEYQYEGIRIIDAADWLQELSNKQK